MIKCADELRGQRFLQVMKALLLDNGYDVEHNAKFDDLSKRIDEHKLTYPGEDVEAADMASLVSELRDDLENTRTENARLERTIELEVERTELAQRRAAVAMEGEREQHRLADEADRNRPADPPGVAGTDDPPAAAPPTDAVAPPATTAEPPSDWAPPTLTDPNGTAGNVEPPPTPTVISPEDDVYGTLPAIDPQPTATADSGTTASRHQPGSKPWQRERASAEGVPFTSRDSGETIETRRGLFATARQHGVELPDGVTSNGTLGAALSEAIEAKREAAEG